ncbi:MAG TPA: type VI secretion system baseplate subunit TssG [Vicinamibacterales bacterium]|nr:type VI secretion system baseplate subunit TssG [Vicinamibacterales bacterium]
MGGAMGREADAVAFFAALGEAPYRFDFYQALRRLECLHDGKPRWGEALRPVDEPVRLGQEPDVSFAPAPLASFGAADDGPPRLQVRLFGLFGPNGPLPLHVTEYARERLRLKGDPTLSRFLDVFHHRLLALFYRAWAQAQPHVSHDRPGVDRFMVYVGSFLGMAPNEARDRDATPDLAKLFHVGALIRQVRNAEGLRRILQHFFKVPVGIEEFVGHWLPLGARERTYLGHDGATLGAGSVLGAGVWDRQHKFRIRLGPLTLKQYESFLPGGTPLRELVDWIRLYLCFELDWDVRLLLKEREVPRLTLGGGGRLGWTTWLGQRRRGTDADDVCLDAEAFVDREGVRAA